MKVKTESTRLLKPSYQTSTRPPADIVIPLSPFDVVSFDTHVATLYAYRPPNPPNSVIEQGLRKALAGYREFAGRFVSDAAGRRCILLNDEGLRFIENISDYPLGSLDKPSPDYLDLHPPLTGMEELAQVQLTRFACGSLVVGFTSHHMVADGFSAGHFLVAWGRATCGLSMHPLPLHDRSIFIPRSPSRFQFEHRGVEYAARHESTTKRSDSKDAIIVQKAQFPSKLIAKLKSMAFAGSPYSKPYSTFECIIAHLWRKITRARGLDVKETTKIRIAVDGRTRMNNSLVPMRYFGNMVLWAWPESRVEDLLAKPIGHAARLIHEAAARVDADYFKSFIDFSSSKEKTEGLMPSADEGKMVLSPDLEVDSWLRFPFYDVDFGSGRPHRFMPSYLPVEGLLILVPSFSGNGDVDAFVPLFEKDLDSFKNDFYSLD
ncbi:agmatine coumaroyltransferase-1-like [Nymphaea colorata]|nr:agmatine coumaroyltransferase-1-like [Nymphaea colorata]